jgi:hypothetical protein
MKMRLLRVHIKVCSPLRHFPGAKLIGTCAQIFCYCGKHYVQNLTLNYTVQPLNIYIYTEHLESCYALTKGIGSDVHEHLYRPETELN